MVLLVMAVVSLGATIVVDDDGGTPDLATALASAQPGDTVLVRPGTYVGSFDVPEDVTLLGSGPEQTILDGAGADWTVGLLRGAHVSRFTITGGENGIEAAFGSVRITGNVIESNGPASAGAGILLLGCGSEIRGNVIAGNQGGGVWMFVDNGVCDSTEPAPIITNNVIHGNTGGHGLFVRDDYYYRRQQWPVMTHNTITGNQLYGAYFWSDYTVYYLPTPTGRLTNNVITGNGEGGVGNYIYNGGSFYSYGPPTSDNVFSSNGTPQLHSPDTSIGQDGNVIADPMFRDPAAGDYRLQPGSPAIDAGEALPDPATEDLGGFPRPLDGDLDGVALPDLGAFEETGEVAGLMVAADGGSVSWSVRTGATFYNLYRGSLQALRSGGDYTQDPASPAARQWCGLASPTAVEDGDPAAGEIHFYLATPGGPAEGSLGFRSGQELRPNVNPCP